MAPLSVNNVPEMFFNMMPDSQSMAMYKDKLLVYDNINTPLSETYTDEVKDFIGSLPVKIDFTVTLLCLEGRVDIGCNLLHYSIGPDEIAVFTPGTIGESIKIAPDSKLIVMAFADGTYIPSGQLKRDLFSLANFNHPLKFSVEQDMIWPMVQEYQHLKRAMLSTGRHVDALISSYVMVLTSFAAMSLGEWVKENQPDTAGHVVGSKLYNDFMDLLAKNFIDHKDVAFYAQASGLSPKYFSKQIFKASGKHPLEWIKAQVILNAQAMLNSKEYSIAEISQTLKFSSQSAFNRYFKDETGVTPKEYQKQND